MRRIGLLALVGILAAAQCGCLLNIWSGDPVRRSRQLLVVSENLRVIEDEWERIWFTDQPSHLTPYRVDGGVVP
jgi:hypothetical protein